MCGWLLFSIQRLRGREHAFFYSAADQCAGGGPTWDLAYCTDKSINRYNCLKDDKDPVVHNLSIVAACTVIILSEDARFITLVHRMICNKSPHPNESLALPFQLMNHRENADLIPQCCATKEGKTALNLLPLTVNPIHWNLMVENFA